MTSYVVLVCNTRKTTHKKYETPNYQASFQLLLTFTESKCCLLFVLLRAKQRYRTDYL